MSRHYDVLYDFGISPGTSDGKVLPPDSVSASPYAVVAVWRYRYPVTFDRTKKASFTTDVSESVKLRDKPLIICDDLQGLQIQSTKSSHIGQLNMSLLPGMNYMVEVFPGDWISAWIVYGEDTLRSLIDRIHNTGGICNNFYDGLKFMGRVTAVRKRIAQDPGGMRRSSYSINAASFTEFDASLYYEPYLASDSPGTATDWLKKAGVLISELISKNGQGISINDILPVLLNVFYGTGVPKNQGFSTDNPRLQSTAGLDNPNSLIIPEAVAGILGVTKGSKPHGQKSWTDILEVLQGVQKYGDVGDTDNQKTLLEGRQVGAEFVSGAAAGRIFTPEGVNTNPDTRHRETRTDMMGIFLPSPPQFTGQKTVWSILQQYLNPAVNEMFTCFRTNPEGNVFPTLVVRQLPFSSGLAGTAYKPVDDETFARGLKNIYDKAADARKKGNKQKAADIEAAVPAYKKTEGGTNLNLTRFMELPRWKVHPILIKSVDVGRSDSLRFNFIHVMPETGLASEDRTKYIVRDPPIRDDLDIARSGLRPYMLSVNCSPKDALNHGAGRWMHVLSDILMGQQMLLTGVMETVGIQSPICIGDNIEFDSHVFHIESVSHTFQITGNGNKTFSTSLALTHGMKAEQATRDLTLYSGTAQQDITKFDAAQTRDYRYSPSTPSIPEEGVSETPKEKPKPPSGFDEKVATKGIGGVADRMAAKGKKK